MKRATQALCVSRRMAAGVVVEVGEHGTAFAQPQVYPICPAVQRSVVVVLLAPVERAGSVRVGARRFIGLVAGGRASDQNNWDCA